MKMLSWNFCQERERVNAAHSGNFLSLFFGKNFVKLMNEFIWYILVNFSFFYTIKTNFKSYLELTNSWPDILASFLKTTMPNLRMNGESITSAPSMKHFSWVSELALIVPNEIQRSQHFVHWLDDLVLFHQSPKTIRKNVKSLKYWKMAKIFWDLAETYIEL